MSAFRKVGQETNLKECVMERAMLVFSLADSNEVKSFSREPKLSTLCTGVEVEVEVETN